MSDTIYRQDAIKTFCMECKGQEFPCEHQGTCRTMYTLSIVPSARPKEGKWIDKGWKGDWQFETDGRGNCWREYECSECGFHKKVSKSNYCPHCGADMRERKDFQVIVNGNCTICGKPLSGNSIFICEECEDERSRR